VSNPKSFRLAKCDPGDNLGWHKDAAIAELAHVKLKLDEIQQRLAAEDKRSVLLVLQALDAAGKDGTIRMILSGLNPAGVEVTSFKVPVGRETEQDYLWRVHAAAPRRGEIGVFNRSHYEEVLVVRVKGLVAPSVWRKRFRHINEFERLLTDEGTTVVKCFLNVSKKEQARRFQDRLDDPTKNWKFRAADLEDRKLWPKYQHAYQDAIRKTSTSYAPWYVVPADHNWVRNLAVAKILLKTMQALDPKFPPPEPGITDIKIT
jgi:PPK2 family polyphosphate:nucleotide phosphotransferase